ncbi:carboxypeptidase-like regulatory domain-containing protein [Hymenobacter arizonensis]|uniref:CarboxypepD_reg-like domain-containing protein n=1 Tax=Hymenobacter arizonensis TaxID=1227077 RepID=A0A1I5WNP3_HYMAR|nr:carboxypeptidase-like regulatory domain-containing protein [Hymenobacter arizonensis]SFQ21329.1 CarboxypepD_reg-like domain-containing protein [Hymenobacter arizonensis]
MCTSFFLLVSFWLMVTAAAAQTISGSITNTATQEGLPYVNIGVVGKDLGTVSNESGYYKLVFRADLANDTVRVSSLGYRTRLLTLRELLAQPNVALTPESVPLAEVLVKGKSRFRRTHTLGNTGNSEMATNTLSSNSLGSQVGTVIKLNRQPTKLLNAVFNIARSSPGQVTFRVNIYRLDARGLPTETKLLNRNVIVSSPIVRGPITVDLSADQLVLSEDFFLAIEMIKWVDAAPSGAEFAFSAAVGYSHNEIYYRKGSQALWKRASVGALLAGMQPKLSFYVTVND